MKLNFRIAPHDGMLEVRTHDGFMYTIYEIGDVFRAVGWKDGNIKLGDHDLIYDALEACNKHYYGAAYEQN